MSEDTSVGESDQDAGKYQKKVAKMLEKLRHGSAVSENFYQSANFQLI